MMISTAFIFVFNFCFTLLGKGARQRRKYSKNEVLQSFCSNSFEYASNDANYSNNVTFFGPYKVSNSLHAAFLNTIVQKLFLGK